MTPADATEIILDILTVLTAAASVGSGCWLFGRPWIRRPIRLRAIVHDDPYARGLLAGGASTFLALWHLGLMVYWSLQDGGDAIGVGVNAAFDAWHTLIALMTIWFHGYVDREVRAAASV